MNKFQKMKPAGRPIATANIKCIMFRSIEYNRISVVVFDRQFVCPNSVVSV